MIRPSDQTTKIELPPVEPVPYPVAYLQPSHHSLWKAASQVAAEFEFATGITLEPTQVQWIVEAYERERRGDRRRRVR